MKFFTIVISLFSVLVYGQIKLNIKPSMVIDEKAYRHSDVFNMFDEQSTFNTEPPVGSPSKRWGAYLDEKLYYPLTAVIDFGHSITISNMYVYDGSGSGVVEFYIGTLGNWSLVVTEPLTKYNSWNKYTINKATRYVRVVNYQGGNNFNEVVFYGDKQTLLPTSNKIAYNYPTVDDYLGANILHDRCPPSDASVFKHLREFHDWNWDEADQSVSSYPGYPKNQYAFNPSWVASWNFDNVYKGFKDNKQTVYPTLQGSAFWFLGKVEHDSSENKPSKYNMNAESPASYLEHADYMYQFAARYGSKPVATSTLKLRSTNNPLTGLNLIDGIENWNEPDKNWKGRRGLFLPYEYAAMSSADYDGHEKTLGATLGLKNADPDLKFIMAGLISLDTNYIKAMKFWFENNRKDKKFIPDVINFHNYCNDGSGQGSAATKGISPEAFNLEAKTKAVVDYCKRTLPEKKVWITEFGYDVNQGGSDQKVIPYDSYTAEQVQSMWLLRNYLAYAAAGVDRAYMFWLTDNNSNDITKFESSGLIGRVNNVKTFRPSYYAMATMRNTLKNYKFNSKPLSGNANVVIQEYVNATNTDSVVYVLWCPTSNSTSVSNYALTLPTNTLSAKKVEYSQGSLVGLSTALTITSGTIALTVTENPIYVVMKKTATINSLESSNLIINTSVFPNPTEGILNVNSEEIIGKIQLLDISGLLLQELNVDNNNVKIDVSNYNGGVYVLKISNKEGNKQKIEKIIIEK